MRLFFPNTTRPKKAAKHIARRLGLPLAHAQRGVACACGYRDWHELERSAAASPPSLLDQHLTSEDFVARQVRLSLALAAQLGTPDGDAQCALARARLTGDRMPDLGDQIAIRLACFRATSLPVVPARMPGAVGELKSPGRNGERVILRRFGRPTETITHEAIMTVADFEYVSPRRPVPLFLPMRLYLPYGAWTEEDGSRVIFARDYKPLWRLRMDGAVERLEPWLWIRFREQAHFSEDANTPWHDPRLKAELEARLAAMGIAELPILADALPLLVNAPAERRLNMDCAAELLKDVRAPAPPLAA
jgi:hypothetical protein